MKPILRTSLIIVIVLALAGCTLPEITPVPSPSNGAEPTSTAPVVPTAIPSPETGGSIEELITANNAARLQAVARSANSNVQFMTWSLDSQSITLISQNPSDNGSQVFGAGNLTIPSLDPGYVWAAQPGERILAASPDGITLAVLSSDQMAVTLVDGKSGKTLREVPSAFSIEYGSFSPDGKTLALTSKEDWKVQLFEVENGQELPLLTGFDTAAPVFDAGFAGINGVIVWHARGTLQLQDTTTQNMSKPFNHEEFVGPFTLSPDGSLLASGSTKTLDGIQKPVIYLWNTQSGDFIRALPLDNPTPQQGALSFSPDGKLLAVAEGNFVQVWDVANEAVLATLAGNSSLVRMVAFSPDGRMLASTDNDNQFILWAVVK